MRKRKVTFMDYQRLIGFMEIASLQSKMPELEERLYDELKRAEIVPSENISKRVVTMNSRVLLKELSSGKEIELTVTYPKDSNPRERKISVFTPIGMAVLGRLVGDEVTWKIPGGNGQFEIVKVTYQPEAVGDFNL